MNTFRNIHVKAPTPAPALPNEPSLPRLRVVTNDPAREYAQRPGEVQPLPDSVAALILARQEFRKVSRNGIIIEFEGRKLNYWSENSLTIATKAGTNEKVLVTFNRQQPDVIHILSADGEYVESIPLDGKAPWFDQESFGTILAAKRRANQRRMDRIAHLHKPDAQAALEREIHNEGQLRGLVQTFPAPDRSSSRSGAERIDPKAARSRAGKPLSRAESESREGLGGLSESSNNGARHNSARDSFPRAARLHEIQRSLGEARAQHEERERAQAKRIAAVTEEDLDDLLDGPAHNFTETNSPDLGVEAVLTATESQEEEDASDLIL